MFTGEKRLYVAHCAAGPLAIEGRMATRHGLIAGATGTGKTVSLQVLAETFSQAGVPCFMADMKGDLSGISQPGGLTGFIGKRCAEFGIEPSGLDFRGCPVRFFDLFGEQGHPIRATVRSMGAALLARLLELNETQTGVLAVVFRIAADEELELIDLKDLRLTLDHVAKNAPSYTTTYGNVSAASIGAIQRSLLALEEQGAAHFFGEPAFDVFDLLQTRDGRGVMNVLAADKLMLRPKLYSTFLMWLLTGIYERLPEAGELELPKLVFFFDEAHMLFRDTPKAMLEKIEQVVRLIRSKGVGIYFVTQSPSDIPEAVLGQLGNRVQHALRAFTPRDEAAVKSAARTFRANPSFDTAQAITGLGTGEALVSFLDDKGSPSVVERAKMLFPLSHIGAVSEECRRGLIASSDLAGKYDRAVDRESAFEKIRRVREEAQREESRRAEEKARAAQEKQSASRSPKRTSGSGSFGKSLFGSLVGSLLGAFTRTLAREAAKSVTGSVRRAASGSKSTSTRSGSPTRRK